MLIYRVILLILFSSFTFYSIAQVNEDFVIGTGMALNIPSIRGDVEGSKIKGGVAVGCSVYSRLQPNLGFGGGVYYSAIGGEFNVMLEDNSNPYYQYVSNESINYRLRYITAPVFAKIYPSKTLNLNFQIGVQPSVLLSAQKNYAVTSIERVDAVDDLNRFDLSIPIGIGYDLHYSSWLATESIVSIELKYLHGVTDVFKDQFEYQGKNRVFQLLVTYQFALS
tara:strand:- start:1151 stop:1819 length:669 start_codon:yes stop_codon:yes gene_type:complete